MTQKDLTVLGNSDIDSAARLIARRARYGSAPVGIIKLGEGEEEGGWRGALSGLQKKVQEGGQSAWNWLGENTGAHGYVDSLSRRAGGAAQDAAKNKTIQDLQELWSNNPSLRYGVYGAGLGGLAGLGSGMVGKKKRPFSNLLTGALLGGAAGAGGRFAWDSAFGDKKVEKTPEELAQEARDKEIAGHLEGATKDQTAAENTEDPAEKARLAAAATHKGRFADAVSNRQSVMKNEKDELIDNPLGPTPVRATEPVKVEGVSDEDASALPKKAPIKDDLPAMGRNLVDWATGKTTTGKRPNVMANPGNQAVQLSTSLNALTGPLGVGMPGIGGGIASLPASAALANQGIQRMPIAFDSSKDVNIKGEADPPEIDPTPAENVAASPGVRGGLQGIGAMYGLQRLRGGLGGAYRGLTQTPTGTNQTGLSGAVNRIGRGFQGFGQGSLAGALPISQKMENKLTGRYNPELETAYNYARSKNLAKDLKDVATEGIGPPPGYKADAKALGKSIENTATANARLGGNNQWNTSRGAFRPRVGGQLQNTLEEMGPVKRWLYKPNLRKLTTGPAPYVGAGLLGMYEGMGQADNRTFLERATGTDLSSTASNAKDTYRDFGQSLNQAGKTFTRKAFGPAKNAITPESPGEAARNMGGVFPKGPVSTGTTGSASEKIGPMPAEKPELLPPPRMKSAPKAPDITDAGTPAADKSKPNFSLQGTQDSIGDFMNTYGPQFKDKVKDVINPAIQEAKKRGPLK